MTAAEEEELNLVLAPLQQCVMVDGDGVIWLCKTPTRIEKVDDIIAFALVHGVVVAP